MLGFQLFPLLDDGILILILRAFLRLRGYHPLQLGDDILHILSLVQGDCNLLAVEFLNLNLSLNAIFDKELESIDDLLQILL